MGRWCSSKRSDRELEDMASCLLLYEKLANSSMLEAKNYTRTLLVRVMTAVILLLAAITSAILAYLLTENQETRLVETQYESVVEFATDAMRKNLEQRLVATSALARMYGNAAPDPRQWPNVTLKGFNDVADAILPLSSAGAIGYSPIVQPEERAGFQHFAYNYFNQNPEVPATAGRSYFGDGIYLVDLESDENPDFRYPDFDGSTDYGSPNKILTPLLQLRTDASFQLEDYLYNIHSSEFLGGAIDRSIACAVEEHDKGMDDDGEMEALSCGSLSESFVIPCVNDVCDELHPIVSIVQPIFPANNRRIPVGFMSLGFSWLNVLEGLVPNFVTGLDIVIESSEGTTFTFTITDGKVKVRGSGDRHDDGYESYKESIQLVEELEVAPQSVTYTVSYYPRDEFLDQYRTDLPRNTTIGVVLIMVLTTVIFIIHDYFLKRESNERQAVLETKRKFVRFISHEIRTPLNTVILGLKLLMSELKEASQVMEGAERVGASSGVVEESDETFHATSAAATKTITSVPLFKGFGSWFDLIGDIETNTQSAIAVLNDLLNYDKIEMGTMELDLKAVNIWSLGEGVVQAFEVQARQAEVSLVLNLPQHDMSLSVEKRKELEVLRVLGDEMRLTQVLRNLISNALKFTPPNGLITVTGIYIRASMSAAGKKADDEKQSNKLLEPLNGVLRFTLTDTGAGLSPEQLQRIFKEGVQFNAKELQAGQGSGLGLAISKGLIEQHGGVLSVSSEGLGKGCTFTVELPAYRLKEEHSPLVNSTLSGKMNVFMQQSTINQICSEKVISQRKTIKKILVVDDSATNRKMLIRLLTKEGHQCVDADDGDVALMRYKECPVDEPFDCILMDYEMPRMTGPEAAKELRRMGCELLIVGITGNVLPADRAYYKEMGANEVLTKPLNLDELNQVFNQFEGKHQLRLESLSCSEKMNGLHGADCERPDFPVMSKLTEKYLVGELKIQHKQRLSIAKVAPIEGKEDESVH